MFWRLISIVVISFKLLTIETMLIFMMLLVKHVIEEIKESKCNWMEMNDIEKDISNEYCLHGNLLFLLFLTIK